MAKNQQPKKGETEQKDLAKKKRITPPAFLKQRSFRYGSTATAFIALFIVGVVIVNVLVTALSNRFPISFDLTSTQKSSISQETIKYIKDIKQTVYIDILAEESAYANTTNYDAALRIMKQYAQYNSNIKLEFINLDKNPTYASQYSEESLSTADIIVRTGSGDSKRYKHISYSDLISTSSSSYSTSSSSTTATANNTEQEIDSALAYVTTTDLPTVVVTSGHDEQDISDFTSLLEKNNYTVETKATSTEGIDQNASLVIIAAPTTDFTTDDIAKLDTYLDNDGKYGKNVLLIFSPTQSSLPNLEAFAAKWGITPGTGVVYETESSNIYSTSSGSNPLNFIQGDLDSDYTGTIKSGLDAMISVARPLTLASSETSDGATATSVMATPSTTKLWNPGDLSTATFTESESDESGPFDVMAVGVKTKTEDSTTVKSNVLVLGSLNFINSTLLSTSSLSNSTIMLNTIANVVGFEPGITVESKDLTTQTITASASEEAAITIIFGIMLPIAILIAGIATWVRRKNQ